MCFSSEPILPKFKKKITLKKTQFLYLVQLCSINRWFCLWEEANITSRMNQFIVMYPTTCVFYLSGFEHKICKKSMSVIIINLTLIPQLIMFSLLRLSDSPPWWTGLCWQRLSLVDSHLSEYGGQKGLQSNYCFWRIFLLLDKRIYFNHQKEVIYRLMFDFSHNNMNHLVFLKDLLNAW